MSTISHRPRRAKRPPDVILPRPVILKSPIQTAVGVQPLIQVYNTGESLCKIDFKTSADGCKHHNPCIYHPL